MLIYVFPIYLLILQLAELHGMPEAASRSTSPTLNVLDLLPVGFVKRFDVPTDLSVTPPPADLERNIDSHMESDRSPWTKDLQALFPMSILGTSMRAFSDQGVLHLS